MSTWQPESFTIDDIVELINDKKLTVPPYQRGNVWDDNQEKELIDSIKKGFPFGSILLYEDEDNEFHLIDGLQRSTTFYKFATQPANFFASETDIPDKTISKIIKIMNLAGNRNELTKKIRSIIDGWVSENYRTLADINTINAFECANELTKHFPSVSFHQKELIYTELFDAFNAYKEKSQLIINTRIPAIVYKGDEENLYEVFTRINNQGTKLTKHQIFAASWSIDYVKITERELFPIVEYVSEFYESIEAVGFGISKDYKENIEDKNITVYQMIFGFSKFITENYPGLFGTKKKINEVESVGFNLINACLGNKNSNMVYLPKVLYSHFKTDEEINKFLININKSIKFVDNIFKKYYSFKLNKRKGNNVYHSEFQIVSLIANLFIIQYGNIEEIDFEREKVNLSIIKNKNIKKAEKNFRDWAFIRYVYDNLNNHWSGTGDKKIDEIIMNPNYYTQQISSETFENALYNWFHISNSSKNEKSKVSNPNNVEKLLLTIIYLDLFSAHDQLGSSLFDIEHLCTKSLMKEKLRKYEKHVVLPISSFGNICLLPEWDNRSKKDKILYEDEKYLNKVGEYLGIIEEKYTFTNEEMFDFIFDDSLNSEEFTREYMNFLSERFVNQLKHIIKNLYEKEPY